MADTSYCPKVYRQQGGDKLVVASGGYITAESGGYIDCAGTLTNSGTLANTGAITNTGTITNSSDGYILEPLTARTAATTLKSYGTDLIGSTTAGARAYKIDRPGVAGKRKTLICRASTGAVTVISATATASVCKFNRTLTKLTFLAAADNKAVDLIGETSTSWSVVGWTTMIKSVINVS